MNEQLTEGDRMFAVVITLFFFLCPAIMLGGLGVFYYAPHKKFVKSALCVGVAVVWGWPIHSYTLSQHSQMADKLKPLAKEFHAIVESEEEHINNLERDPYASVNSIPNRADMDFGGQLDYIVMKRREITSKEGFIVLGGWRVKVDGLFGYVASTDAYYLKWRFWN